MRSAKSRMRRALAPRSPRPTRECERTSTRLPVPAEVTRITPEEVISIKRSAQALISLEKPVGDEDGSEFGAFIVDERAASPYDRTEEVLLREALCQALSQLPDRERRVLELRYGLDGERTHTYDEIGRELGVTRERIRQLEHRSFQRLREQALMREVWSSLAETG